MLEFLKSFTKFNIYDRARDCEINLRSFDSMTSMAVFFESVLKAIYNDLFEENVGIVSSYSLNDLLKDDYFIAQVRAKYGISESDYEIIDRTIRVGSNKNKHGLNSAGNDRQLVKKAFKCLYDFASNYLYVETGLTAPEWSEEAYEALVNVVMDENARAKAEAAYSAKIKLLKEERDTLKKQKEENQNNLLKLRKEIDQIRKESIPIDQYESISNDINRLKDEITRKETDIVRLEANAERSKKEKKIQKEAYEFEIEALKKKLKLAEKKFVEAGDSSDQKDRIQALESAINESKNQIAENQVRLAGKEKELASISAKLYEAQDLIDELNRRHIELLTERKEKQAQIDRLEKGNRQLSEVKSEIEPPKCVKCGAFMKIKPSKYGNGGYYWACSNYGKNCSGSTRSFCQEDYLRFEKEADNARIIEDNKRTINLRKKEIEDSTKEFQSNLPQYVLSGFNQELKTKIECYPAQYTRYVPSTFLFESICVPPEIFKERHELKLKKYSQFKIISNSAVNEVDKKEKTIYSLILRLLNRGIILKTFEKTAKKFKKKFNADDDCPVSSVECLSDFVRYKVPFMISSSKREQDFANYYFPQVLGENWASYVFSQVGFDLLVPEPQQNKTLYGQKVDFLIHKGNAKIVVELDGPEHESKRYNDNYRDNYLRRNNYTVLRFSNVAVDHRDDDITAKLQEVIPQGSAPEKVIELNDKYLVACKVSHQIAIAVMKALEQGYIGKKSCIHTSISSPLFAEAETEFIQTVTIQELKDLLKTYAAIYDLPFEWTFDDESAERFEICVGDGILEKERGMVLRDCSIPNDFLCVVDKFDETVKPVTFSRIKGGFLSEYIYGYRLKPEQYEAVERLITRKDSIVLLPTGYGKSTIYQLSSYIVPGMIVVISPLISLIRDQVSNLEEKAGIDNVAFLYSAADEKEQIRKSEEMLKMCRTTVSMLYLSPERLQVTGFEHSARGIQNNNPVYCIAIDEAHCVSEWGHDFRPAYLNIGNSSRHLFTNKLGEVPVIVALTGTASDAVLNDMRRDLGITEPDSVIEPVSFERSELHFSLVSCNHKDKSSIIADIIKNKLPQKFGKTYEEFASLQNKNVSSGIVFTPLALASATSQYSAMSVQASLSNMLPEVGSACYFTRTPLEFDEAKWNTIKNANADKFKNNKLNLLVATKAFGMGIDKPNIRYIIHDGIPASLEEFYQEAGRAGRDRKDSECVIVFSDENHEENINLLTANYTNFNEEYNNYCCKCNDEDKRDDLSALFYFHSGSYKGVEKECSTAQQVINEIELQLKRSVRSPNQSVKISYSPDYGFNEDKSLSLDDYRKTLVRLTILGAVEYYSIDYVEKVITILLGSIEKDSLINKFNEYTSANEIGNKAPVKTKLDELNASDKKDWEFVYLALRQLITYVYENIESSRRVSIRTMYETAEEMQKAESDQEQHDIVKKRINYYFNSTTETKDLLKSIINDDNLGVKLSLSLLDIEKPKESFSSEDIEKAERIYVRASRLLESAPTHPGLLLTRALTSLIDNKYNKQLLFGDISTACDYAIKEYSISKETVIDTMYSVSNLMMDNSIDLFDEYMEQLPESLEMDKTEMYENLLSTPKISDENREYILLQYTLQKLDNLKGNERK